MAGLEREEIRALARVLDELDYYQLLEIRRGASASEVKRAYYASARRFRPEGHPGLEAELRHALENICKRVSEAYSVVRDPRRRRAYDKRLQDTEAPVRMQLSEANADAERTALEEHVGSTAKGRRFYLLARADRERGDLAAAARNLQMALTFEPGNAVFKDRLEEIRSALREG